MDISYELYKVFYYVASTLSFSEASRQLYISQSAVSQSIRALEKKLGQPLFSRSTKKVSLTAQGELLFRHISPAISLIQQGEIQLTQNSSLAGQLRIGANDTICRYFLVPYLKRFHDKFPHIHIKIMNRPSSGCIELLSNGQVDFIVINSSNALINSSTSVSTLYEFQDVFVANPEYYPNLPSLISLSDLQNYPLLMLDRNSTTSDFLRTIFTSHGLNLVPEAELSSNDLLIDLASIGLGIAFIPDYMMASQTNNLIALQTKEKLPKRQLLLAYNEQLPATPAAQTFISILSSK